MNDTEARIAQMLPRTTARIHELFVLSVELAEREARELLDAIESKGGECTNWSVVERLVEQHLGARLTWRSASEKLAAQERRESTVASYNAHINSGRAKWQA